MGRIFLAMVLACFLFASQAQESFFDRADLFFKENVSNNLVQYGKIKNDRSQLDVLLRLLKEEGPTEVSSATDKAMLINAYNLFVIDGIVKAGDINSPQQVNGFFDSKVFELSGTKISLNELEKDLLLTQTKDPRLHFVLVCAAMSCPPIIAEAYKPETIDQQLDRQTRNSLNNDAFIKVEKADQQVSVSKIFDWYRSDFLINHSSVIAYLNEYREQKISLGYKLTYYDYDWSINDASPKTAIKDKSEEASNLLQFTPSQLFGLGQFELNFFNNLYSQKSVRNKQGQEVESGARLSILTTNIQFTYGISKKANINAGFDVVLSAGARGPESGGFFQLFNDTKVSSDLAVSAIGPRIKYQPIKKWQFFSIQNSFLVPVANDLEATTSQRDVFLALDRYQWRNQFFYDIKLTEEFRLFYEFAINYLIPRNIDESFFNTNFIDTPSSLFVNYFPSQKVSFFASTQYAPRFGNTDREGPSNFGLLQWTLNLGAGAKYQATDKLGFEVSYGNFIDGAGFPLIDAGAGAVLNFGIRYID